MLDIMKGPLIASGFLLEKNKKNSRCEDVLDAYEKQT